MSTITVRQTRDPYDANIEYIACCKMTLESNGDLNMKGLGIGRPGDQFVVQLRPGGCWLRLTHETMPAWQRQLYIRDTELGPVMTVVEINDARAAGKRRRRKLTAERRAEQIAVLKGLFIRPWRWIASRFCTAASFKKHAVQAVLILTDQCPSQRVGGRHLKLLDGIMKHGKL